MVKWLSGSSELADAMPTYGKHELDAMDDDSKGTGDGLHTICRLMSGAVPLHMCAQDRPT